MSHHRQLALLLLAMLAAGPLLHPTPAQAGKKKAKQSSPPASASDRPANPDELRVVDCLLPGQVRKLGRHQTYLTQRRPARITALDCAIRGGEYVAYDRANYATALKVWLASAEGGDAQAQYYVGEIYERGLGTEPDPARAADWYRKSAEQGYGPAQVSLGFLYEKGLGVERDPREALEWYRRGTGVSGVIVLDSELEAMKQELSETHARLVQAERGAADLEAKLATAKQELAAERASGARSAERVAALEGRLTSIQEDLGAQRSEISRLKSASQQLDIAGPTIEIIDLSALRSIPAEGEPPRQELVGRIHAPAGLARFLVDGKETTVDAEGFFEIPVASSQKRTLLAVDLQGKEALEVFDPAAASLRRDSAEARPARKASGGGLDLGSYHALIIGNRDYRNLPDLGAVESDARALAAVLETRYGFTNELLFDATLFQVLDAFRRLREELGPGDNLLIYYAGHGELDAASEMGYWLPVDARQDDSTTWLSSTEITDQLSLIPAKHILVIADSCYSGALTRSAVAHPDEAIERQAWLREVRDKRSRTALTSGGLKPVLDQGGAGHSVFARALLDVLSANEDILEGRGLWLAVRTRVEYQTRRLGLDQVPEYAPIRAGHEPGGEFLLAPARG